MNNRDEDYDYLPDEGQEDLSNGFDEPDYGNYDYNDVNNEVPEAPEGIENADQIAQPNQSFDKNADNNALDKLKDKTSGKDAYSKTLDNKNYYDDELAKNRAQQKDLQKQLADAKKENKEKQNILDDKKKNTVEKRNKLNDAKKQNKGNSSAGTGIANKIQNVKNRRIGIANQKKDYKDAKSDEQKAEKDKLDSDKKLDDSKNALKKNKDERKGLLKDKKSADRFKKLHPVQAAKMVVGNVFKKIKRLLVIKILLPFLIILLALAILVDVIYEVFEAVDTAINYAMNVQEKMDNFINGLGFENSEDAFYDELDELQARYNNQIDVPLLLSTLFYDDIQNNMDPSDVGTDVVTDDDSLISFSAVFGYIKQKYEESEVTIGPNGYKYSSNKIYRMRMLAKNMVEKGTATEKKTLHKHILDVAERIGRDLTNIFSAGNLIRALLDALTFGLFEGFGLVEDTLKVLSGEEIFETTDLYNSITHTFGSVIDMVKALFSLVFDIESIYLCAGATYSTSDKKISYKDENGNEKTITEDDMKNEGTTYDPGLICVDVATYTTASENYFDYLKKEYIPKMPEFKKYINSSDETMREQDIDRIISEIKDIYDDYKFYFETEPQNAELYNENEIGAINPLLVNQLRKPVDGNFTGFSGKDAYGVYNGKMQNGVVLTHTNSGINEGDPVYAVAKGKVTGIGRSNGTIEGSSEYILSSGFKSYPTLTEEQLQAIASQCHAEQGSGGIEGIKAEASLMANLYEYQGGSATSVYDYVMNGSGNGRSWFAHSKMHMNPVCKDAKSHPNECSYINSDGDRVYVYYTYTEEELAAVRTVLTTGERTLPVYIDEHDTLGDIDKLTINGEPHTDRDFIRNKDNYITGQTVIHNRYGSTYTFYKFPSDGSDPFGYKQGTYNHYQNAVSTDVEENKSNWVKIEHNVTVDGTTTPFKFTTIYRYLGSISDSISVGGYVEKGQVIGTVGTVYGYSEPSLYFEFRDETGKAINPTNLFITSLNGGLVGSNNKEKIWFYLLDHGFTKAGAAAAIGNLIHESSFNPVSLEKSSRDRSGYTSEQYTQEVDSGKITKAEFICSDRFGLLDKHGNLRTSSCKANGYEGGIYGYGLFGFTYPTVKENLAKHTIDVGVSIGDLKAQLDSFVEYLEQASPALINTLKTTNDPKAAAESVYLDYERPQSMDDPVTRAQAIRDRGNSAQKTYDEMKDVQRPAATPTPNQTPSYQTNGTTLVWPAPKTKKGTTSSRFGLRTHPKGYKEYHHGEDIPGTEGDPILSASDGIVCGNGWTDARGWYILVFNEETKTKFVYQHMYSKSSLAVGTKVSAGQRIGSIGDTGDSYGAHLHFEIHINDINKDSIPWVRDGIAPGTVDPKSYNYIDATVY